MNRKSQVYVGKFRKFLRDFIDRAAEDDISGLGAQMSYYFILSFFPFLIFLIALLSYTNITSEDFISKSFGLFTSRYF
jgi:membrane protein